MTGHVLVTGGASGIGAATAHALASRGCRVSILDRTVLTAAPPATAEWWNSLSEDLRGEWAVADALDSAAYGRAVDGLASRELTGLVSCAGMSVKDTFLDSTDESWEQTIRVNVLGTALACRSVARAMVARGRGGAIVNVASTVAAGYVAGLGTHYHASKGAIVALTRAMAAELGAYGIRVNAVAPGLVRTPLTEYMRNLQGEDVLTKRVPLRTMADPEQVADAVLFLLSPDASMITGHVLPVDAGQLSVVGTPLEGFPDVDPRVSDDNQ